MGTTRPNIVFVICHDLGQHLGCYGQRDVRSTNIDEFASKGVRFANSFCAAPQCSPSRAALWTGRFPHANGVVGLTHAGFANDLNLDEIHLAQILRAAGYETHLFGLQHEARMAERCGHEFMHPGWTCEKIANDFARFVTQRTKQDAGSLAEQSESNDRPLFAQIGFFEPHRPFPHEGVETLPPDQLAVPPYLPDIPVVREDLADIEASIVSVDRAFGCILEAIRSSSLADDTLIVFTADHGIGFPHAKMTLYDPGIEVALIMSGPGLARGVVYNEMVSNVDLVPTLLELADLPYPGDKTRLHGRSFCGLLRGKDYQPNEYVFAEKTYHTYYDPMRAIRSDRWKLIANFEFAPSQETATDYLVNAKGYVEVARALNVPYDRQYHPPFELYDLESDPHEQHDLADDGRFAAVRNDLIVALRDWMKATDDPLLDGPMTQGAYRERMKAFKEIRL